MLGTATFDDGLLWWTIDASSANSWTQVVFTTSTQGAAITGDGTMLVTHGAGSKWRPVDLPPIG